MEPMVESRGSIADVFAKKPKRRPFNFTNPAAQLAHSGDGSVPYLSLSWAHTWLLHAARARRHTEDNKRQHNRKKSTEMKNALDYIQVSHRPRGELDWVDGPPPAEKEGTDKNARMIDDTGTSHPHGTRYSEYIVKRQARNIGGIAFIFSNRFSIPEPLMKKFHNIGISRTTGIEYTTSVIEAVGVEHKETTR